MMRLKRRCLTALLGTVLTMGVLPLNAAPPPPVQADLAADSLYWVNAPLQDSSGRHFTLKDMAGHPLLVTMFYGDCNTACPVVLESLRNTMQALAAKSGEIQVLLISLDPSHDTPSSLAKLAADHHLDASLFRLAVSDGATHTRAIAAALGIRYRALANGEINHSTRLVLLDATGRVLTTSSQLAVQADPTLLAQLRKAIATN